MKSIIQKREDECFLCGNTYGLQIHHLIGGTANRKLSEKYGLRVALCQACHTGDCGVHFDKDLMDSFHRLAQRRFEQEYPDLDFKDVFGKYFI